MCALYLPTVRTVFFPFECTASLIIWTESRRYEIVGICELQFEVVVCVGRRARLLKLDCNFHRPHVCNIIGKMLFCSTVSRLCASLGLGGRWSGVSLTPETDVSHSECVHIIEGKILYVNAHDATSDCIWPWSIDFEFSCILPRFAIYIDASKSA